MENQSVKEEGVSLPAEVNIKNASQVKSILNEVLASQSCLKIDTSMVQAIDTAGIQLLLVFSSHCKKLGISVWKTPLSGVILEFCESMGIDKVQLSCQ